MFLFFISSHSKLFLTQTNSEFSIGVVYSLNNLDMVSWVNRLILCLFLLVYCCLYVCESVMCYVKCVSICHDCLLSNVKSYKLLIVIFFTFSMFDQWNYSLELQKSNWIVVKV